MGPEEKGRRPTRSAVMLALAVLALVLSAGWSVPIPGTDVPQTAQTLAVVVVGSLLGSRLGPLAVAFYLLLGAIGFPVFAEGRSGLGVVLGPTGGFLVGFVVAAAIAGTSGWLRARRGARLPEVLAGTFAAMLLGHAAILGLGWAWLAGKIGAAAAFEAGVRPFLIGAVAKSALGALLAQTLLLGWRGLRGSSRGS